MVLLPEATRDGDQDQQRDGRWLLKIIPALRGNKGSSLSPSGLTRTYITEAKDMLPISQTNGIEGAAAVETPQALT